MATPTRLTLYPVFLFLLAAVLAAAPPAGADFPVPAMDPAGYPAPNTGCLAPGPCHAGIEPIRAHDSEMAKRIYAQHRSIMQTEAGSPLGLGPGRHGLRETLRQLRCRRPGRPRAGVRHPGLQALHPGADEGLPP